MDGRVYHSQLPLSAKIWAMNHKKDAAQPRHPSQLRMQGMSALLTWSGLAKLWASVCDHAGLCQLFSWSLGIVQRRLLAGARRSFLQEITSSTHWPCCWTRCPIARLERISKVSMVFSVQADCRCCSASKEHSFRQEKEETYRLRQWLWHVLSHLGCICSQPAARQQRELLEEQVAGCGRHVWLTRSETTTHQPSSGRGWDVMHFCSALLSMCSGIQAF